MLERRALMRLPVRRMALMHFAGIRGVHPCLIENLHFQGACISTQQHFIFAREFDVSLDGFKTTIRCRLLWRRGQRHGVKFVGRRSENGFLAMPQ